MGSLAGAWSSRRPSVSALALGAVGFPTPVAAQSQSADAPANRWAPPSTPWGDPDLQGIWDYRTLTPLERPEEFADRTVATEEEAAEYELRANAVRDRPADGVRLWSGVTRGHWG